MYVFGMKGCRRLCPRNRGCFGPLKGLRFRAVPALGLKV